MNYKILHIRHRGDASWKKLVYQIAGSVIYHNPQVFKKNYMNIKYHMYKITLHLDKDSLNHTYVIIHFATGAITLTRCIVPLRLGLVLNPNIVQRQTETNTFERT